MTLMLRLTSPHVSVGAPAAAAQPLEREQWMGMDRLGQTMKCTVEHLSPPSVQREKRGGGWRGDRETSRTATELNYR